MAMILLSNLSFCYEGSYQPVFEDLSIALDTDWHLGLTGRNGRGKTTLLRLLLGAQGEVYGLRGFTGSIQTKVRFGYFPAPVEHPEWLALEVAQQICPDCQQWQLERELSLLEFPEDALWRPFEQLSGGEKTKLQLAALFLQENAFPLIDEPTNHLDIGSKEMREEKQAVKRTLGETLKAHRTRCQMTQEFEAEALGVSRQTVSKWENGSADPSTTNLLALAKLYGVAAEELLRGIDRSEE